ncbi:MAG: porin [Opitutus sp.]|nr:porin [Opitutus sp.]MCS6247642.1 porin [Opitutus sp.]MCS6274199.1 porin [Opitutus sp.]MCS6276831.1 porin [Opitutus sp.]MCS6301520.1 porin [Opitutus sp.]
MIKHLSKISGVAAFAVIASSASAEVKLDDNFTIDGYAIAAYAKNEAATNTESFFSSGDKMLDAVKLALNGTYGDFKSRASVYSVPSDTNGTAAGNDSTTGLLDAYVTYTKGEIALTVGKFNNYLGYESFDSPNNAFMTSGPADNFGYVASYATGAKLDYTTKEFATGFSVRDSLQRDGFFKGDGDFSDDIGTEVYFMYTGIEKLTVFTGMGYENTDGATAKDLYTYNVWASYALTDKLTLVGSYASTSDFVSLSYTLQASYAVSDALSLAARYGAVDGEAALIGDSTNYTEYGVAGTYTLTKNFAIKSEVNKKNLIDGQKDAFFYAVQGIFKF